MNNERNIQIDQFLQNAGLKDITRTAIPGYASFRRYERISADRERYILMDAHPEKEDVKPFVAVAAMLHELKLSAPEIVAQDIENGFLLLEDLGNGKFNDIFKETPEKEVELYKLAIDVLAHIGKHKGTSTLPEYSKGKLMQEAMLFTDWYLPLFMQPENEELVELREDYTEVISRTIDKLKLPNNVIVLRDYHADNLMLLDDRKNIQKVGLLDFQDALTGNMAYDAVSLLEDARRDVPTEIQKKMLTYFFKIAGDDVSPDDFIHDYNILGAQRNLKILGIFSRLKARDKKDAYLPLIPRVKAYLKQDLEHDALRELREFLESRCRL